MTLFGNLMFPLRMVLRVTASSRGKEQLAWLALAFVAAALVPADLLAQVTVGGSGGNSDWSSSLVSKAEEFKVGAVSVVAVLLGIGGVIIAGYGAVAGDIPWRRVGALIFGAIFLAAIDQIIPALTGS